MVLDQPLDVSIIAQDPRRTQAPIFAGREVSPCDRLGNVFHAAGREYAGGAGAADCGLDGKIRGIGGLRRAT